MAMLAMQVTPTKKFPAEAIMSSGRARGVVVILCTFLRRSSRTVRSVVIPLR